MNNLESLCNELLLNLFDYLNDIDLIRGFYNLNLRFTQLLYSHVHLHFHNFNFRSIYKKDFYFICQEYLPFITARILSLHLSDNDDTPDQINHFLQFFPSFNPFTSLQSLTLSNLYHTYLIDTLINQLPNLTRLTISGCLINFDLTYTNHLIDIIWSLKKLVYCKLENVLPYEIFLSTPTRESFSIQYLILNNLSRNLTELIRLYEYTPSLRYLNISIWDLYSTDEVPLEFQTLNKLQLSFQGSTHVLFNMLKSMSNLTSLIIHTERIILNGYQWEQIIEENLFNLKTFRFLAEFFFPDNDHMEDQIDTYLQSFQTGFWLDKHQWFVQCHWNLSNEHPLIFCYTLPYCLDYFIYENNMKFKSTCIDNQHDQIYHNVQKIFISKEIFSCSLLNFSNIRYLHIDLPFNDHLWSILPTMNHLRDLNIERFHNRNARYQLQTLIDRSPDLYSLTFKSTSFFNPKFLFEIESKTIRKLNLIELNYCFNKPECMNLLKSSFNKRCEILFIKIKKRANILQIVQKMTKLRTLFVQCEDDQWEIEENNIIDWLYHRLPATCSISRDINKAILRLWF